jgi:hypothetical protein
MYFRLFPTELFAEDSGRDLAVIILFRIQRYLLQTSAALGGHKLVSLYVLTLLGKCLTTGHAEFLQNLSKLTNHRVTSYLKPYYQYS